MDVMHCVTDFRDRKICKSERFLPEPWDMGNHNRLDGKNPMKIEHIHKGGIEI